MTFATCLALCLLVLFSALAQAAGLGRPAEAPDEGAWQKEGRDQSAPWAGKFVLVKGGTFQMGARYEGMFGAPDEDEEPVHQVTVSDFRLGVYEVTQAQWEAVMGSNPSELKTCADCPVENVTWEDAQAFLRALNAKTGKPYRLPTEAEWEYAARGGGKDERWAGTSNRRELSDYAWYLANSGNRPHPVGQKKPNGLGLHDMSGNVWEWCQDWYGAYSESTEINPQGPPSGTRRVLRGGSWIYWAAVSTVANRHRNFPDYRSPNYGLRLALSADPGALRLEERR